MRLLIKQKDPSETWSAIVMAMIFFILMIIVTYHKFYLMMWISGGLTILFLFIAIYSIGKIYDLEVKNVVAFEELDD